MAATPREVDDEIESERLFLTPEEGRALFDRRARELVGLSGEEFLARWDAGEIDASCDTPEGRRVGFLAALIPFARSDEP